MNIGLVNCQSVCNKCYDMADYVKDLALVALVITETWLTGNDSDHNIIGDLTREGIHSGMLHALTEKVGDLAYYIVILSRHSIIQNIGPGHLKITN